MEEVDKKSAKSGSEDSHIVCCKWNEVESAEDVFANILSRLPVECLKEFKLISKSWYRVISGHSFVQLQLKWSREHPFYLVYPLEINTMESYLMDSYGKVVKEIALPPHGTPSFRSMICSNDGLICCINHPWNEELDEIDDRVPDFEIRIYNPATFECLLLPTGSPSREMPSVGFSFGPKINEYKVFRIFCTKSELSVANNYHCEVFASDDRSWKVIGNVSQGPIDCCHSKTGGTDHLFLNGNVFWFLPEEDDKSIPGSILTVDKDYNFRTINLPVEANLHTFLTSFEGSLAVVMVDVEHFDLWVLEDYNQPEPEWEVRHWDYIFSSLMDCIYSVVLQKHEILFSTSDDLYLYDLDHRSWRYFRIPGSYETGFVTALLYTESLLSCRGELP